MCLLCVFIPGCDWHIFGTGMDRENARGNAEKPDKSGFSNESWWREMDSNHRSLRQQIYSLPPLAAWVSLHISLCDASARTRYILHYTKLLCQVRFQDEAHVTHCQGDSPVTGTVLLTCQQNRPRDRIVPLTCQQNRPRDRTVPLTG